MAFDNSELVLLAHGNDKKLFFYDGGSDSLATICTAGYFNNSDDDIRMVADDQVLVKGSDGTATLEVLSVSSGSVTTREIGGSGVIKTGTTSADLAATGIIRLTGTTAGTHNFAAPTAGDEVTVISDGVAAHIVSSTQSITFGSTGATTLTLDGQGSGVKLKAASSTQYLIVGSIQPTSTGTDASYQLS